MRVYVESNFVLELALAQEETEFAQILVDLASEGNIDLVFPVFALVEPFWTLRYREKQREQLLDSLSKQVNQLRRSDLHEQFVAAVDPILGKMLDVMMRETEEFEQTLRRLIDVGFGINVDVAHIPAALQYQDSHTFDTFQDALIFTAVMADLETQAVEDNRCFVSKDSDAFGTRIVKDDLARYDCRYIATFRAAVNYVHNSVKS